MYPKAISFVRRGIVAAILLCFMVANATDVAANGVGAEAVPAEADVLADHHASQGDCGICHEASEQPVDDNLTFENARCVDCHGDLEAVAENEREGLVSPHRSHLIGAIACTACHKGHEPSVAYCDACHSFDFELAFAGKWRRSVPPVDSDPAAQARALTKAPRDRTDVVVIGSGGAGLTAAITAREKGAAVILLEKEPVAGGNTKLAAGGMNAAGTRFQTARGIDDSPQQMIDDTLKGGRSVNDPALVEVLAGHSVDAVDWLTTLGADLSDVGRMGGHSVNRTHRPTGGAGVGAHVAQVLWDAAVARGTQIRFNSRAVRILKDGGAVSGVLVHGAHTGYYVIRADAVVLATGGFSRDNRRVAVHDPSLKGFQSTNHPGATGEGLDVATRAGAAMRDLEHIQAHPTYSPVGGVMITEAVRGNGAILVNRDGARFVNEIGTRDIVSAAILAQRGGSAYLVFDETVRRSLKQIEGYRELHIVIEGRSLDDLADRLQVPATVLTATVAGYNEAVAAGRDPLFARGNMPHPLTQPPVYAIEVAPAVHHTMGGVVIDTTATVRGTDGLPVAGLYAAGEVTGGVHGANRLGGNAMTDIVAFGRIAGEQAAAFAQRQ
jgi:fumarate reductase flavoprotein subunit